MPIFSDIVQGRQSQFMKPGLVDTRDWFREKALGVTSVNTAALVAGNPEYQQSAVKPGFMYMFQYDAKMKDTLPYFDKFPLIFPFSMQQDHFMGINLHYLPLMYRARLMDALYNVASDKKYNDKTKLKISYDLLNSSAKYKYFEPCVKKYLKSNVQSRFLMVPSSEWDIALFLPLERFTVNKNKVYQDSLRSIAGR